jgi:hypothetical protein
MAATAGGSPLAGPVVPRPEPVRVPLLRQTWNHTSFVHWPCPPEALRPLVPAELDIDVFEGRAWLSLVLFLAERTRLPGLPPLPYVSTFTEVNVSNVREQLDSRRRSAAPYRQGMAFPPESVTGKRSHRDSREEVQSAPKGTSC